MFVFDSEKRMQMTDLQQLKVNDTQTIELNSDCHDSVLIAPRQKDFWRIFYLQHTKKTKTTVLG